MKILLSCIFLCVLFWNSNAFAEKLEKNEDWQSARIVQNLLIGKASQDILKNMPLLLDIQKENGTSFFISWAKPFADKIPTQPVAAIHFMSVMDIPVEDMCPRAFHEDEFSFVQVIQWLEQSVEALNLFTMKDPKEEKLRQECLQAIQLSLSDEEGWKKAFEEYEKF